MLQSPTSTSSGKSKTTSLFRNKSFGASASALIPFRKNREKSAETSTIASIEESIGVTSLRDNYFFPSDFKITPSVFDPFDPITKTVASADQLALILKQDQLANQSPEEPLLQRWSLSSEDRDRLELAALELVNIFTSKAAHSLFEERQVMALAESGQYQIYLTLLGYFIDKTKKAVVKDTTSLKYIAQLIECAEPDYLEANDTVQILSLFYDQLKNSHINSDYEETISIDDSVHHLLKTLCVLLDAMAVAKVSGISRENLHKPLISCLNSLIEDRSVQSHPYLNYLVNRALQALLHIPNDETKLQACWRIGINFTQAAMAIFNIARTADPNKIEDFVKHLDKALGGVVEYGSEIIKTIQELNEASTNLIDSIREGASLFRSQKPWYIAVCHIESLCTLRRFREMEDFIRELPENVRINQYLIIGLIEAITRVALNMQEDAMTQSTVALCFSIYQDDEFWGKSTAAKRMALRSINGLISKDAPEGQRKIAQAKIQELEKKLSRFPQEKQSFYQEVKSEKGFLPRFDSPCQEIDFPESVLDILNGGSADKDEILSRLDQFQNALSPTPEEMIRQWMGQQLDAFQQLPKCEIPLECLSSKNGPRIPLIKCVEKFFDTHEEKCLQILGEVGKSTFISKFIRSRLKTYQSGDPIILWITPDFMPNLNMSLNQQDWLSQFLHREIKLDSESIESLKMRVIYVCLDGYNNLDLDGAYPVFAQWPEMKVIFTQPISHIKNISHSTSVQSHHDVLQVVIAPPSEEDRLTLVRHYVPKGWSIERFGSRLEAILENSPELNNLFLITIILELLPNGSFDETRPITPSDIYRQFIETSIQQRVQKKMVEAPATSVQGQLFQKFMMANGHNLTSQILEICQNSALEFEKNPSFYRQTINLNHSGIEKRWMEILGYPSKSTDDKIDFLTFLNLAPFKCETGSQYRFRFDGLYPYFIAQAIVSPVLNPVFALPNKTKPSSVPVHTKNYRLQGRKLARRQDTIYSLASYTSSTSTESASSMPVNSTEIVFPVIFSGNLVSKPKIIEMLKDQAIQSPEFLLQLYHLLERSKTADSSDTSLLQQAANAFTIIAKVSNKLKCNIGDLPVMPSFDFKGIKVPGADISYTNIDEMAFDNADFTGVNLIGASMVDTKFLGTKMMKIKLGLFPRLTETSPILACAYNPDNHDTFVYSTHQQLVLYDHKISERFATDVSTGLPIQKLIFSPDGTLLASHDSNEVIVWKLKAQEKPSILQLRKLPRSNTSIIDFIFTTDNQYLIICYEDGKIDQCELGDSWSITTKFQLQLPDDALRISKASIVMDKTEFYVLCVCSHDKSDEQALYFFRSEDQKMFPVATEIDEINAMAFSPHATLFVLGGNQGQLEQWSFGKVKVETELESVLVLRHSYSISSKAAIRNLLFSRDGRMLASSSGIQIDLWRAKRFIHKETLEEKAGEVQSLAFSTDMANIRLISGNTKGNLKIWVPSSFEHSFDRDTNHRETDPTEANFKDAALDQSNSALLKEWGAVGIHSLKAPPMAIRAIANRGGERRSSSLMALAGKPTQSFFRVPESEEPQQEPALLNTSNTGL